MKPGATFDDVRAHVNKTLGRDKGVLDTPLSIPSPESPPYAPGSPAYNPTTPESPPYAPGSPAYNPTTPESTRYEPSSPPYNPFTNESPPFNPTTPEESRPFNPITPESPPPENMYGGEREFEVGEIVYLRGGKKSNTPYNIIKKGDKFLTIESMDPTNYEDDSIQVVLPFELLKHEEYNRAVKTDAFSKPLLKPYSNYVDRNSSNESAQDGQGIVFAPVIKIVNGNDNSINDDATENKAPTQQDSFSVPVIRPIYGGGETNTPQKKEEPAIKPTEAPSSGEGIIDFAKNFLIKKLG